MCILPLLLSGESIVGKWKIDTTKTEQSIDKLSMDENQKKVFIFLSSAGFKSIECFSDKTCIQNAITNIDSCMGNFLWEKNNNDYILTPHTVKLCPDTASISKKTKVTIKDNNLNFLMVNGSDSFSFIYTKTDSTPSKKQPFNNLSNIQYDKIYKSNATDTFDLSTSSLLPTYFYLFFTDKNKFYSLVTTQSDISSINEIKNIIQKESDEFKLSAKEQLEQLKNMPYSHDTNTIRIFSTTVGAFHPNIHGIRGFFNSYSKESNISQIDGGGTRYTYRKCEQITLMVDNTLSCDNSIKYTLLDEDTSYITNKVTTDKNQIVDIDIKAEKAAEKQKANDAYLEAIKEML